MKNDGSTDGGKKHVHRFATLKNCASELQINAREAFDLASADRCPPRFVRFCDGIRIFDKGLNGRKR